MNEIIWKFILSLIGGVTIIVSIVKYRNGIQDLIKKYENLSDLKKSELKYFVYYPLAGFSIPLIGLLILLLRNGFSINDGMIIGIYCMLIPPLIVWMQKEYWRKKSLLSNDEK